MDTGLYLGLKVQYINDRNPITRPWYIIKLGETFVRIAEHARQYPKCESFCVPRGCLMAWGEKSPNMSRCPPAVEGQTSNDDEAATAPVEYLELRPKNVQPRQSMLLPPTKPKIAVTERKELCPIRKGVKTLEGFKVLAAELDLGSHELECIVEIWNGPSPNAPMRNMRVYNFIRNAVAKRITK